jgi:hypothetical protein
MGESQDERKMKGSADADRAAVVLLLTFSLYGQHDRHVQAADIGLPLEQAILPLLPTVMTGSQTEGGGAADSEDGAQAAPQRVDGGRQAQRSRCTQSRTAG